MIVICPHLALSFRKLSDHSFGSQFVILKIIDSLLSRYSPLLRDLIRLARKEDESNFDLLSREDAAFLASVEMKCKNDWEITLQDRYRSQVARA